MSIRLGLAVTLAAVFGCESGDLPATQTREPSEKTLAAPAPEAPTPPSDGRKTYGAPIAAGANAELTEVLKSPESFTGKDLIISGHVRRACTRMGCWMELAAGTDPATPACRVTFHGHGFFVPKDSAGSEARVQGRLEVVTVSPAHAAHLEEEGARVAGKDNDGIAREVRLLASGVELYRRGG